MMGREMEDINKTQTTRDENKACEVRYSPIGLVNSIFNTEK